MTGWSPSPYGAVQARTVGLLSEAKSSARRGAFLAHMRRSTSWTSEGVKYRGRPSRASPLAAAAAARAALFTASFAFDSEASRTSVS